MTPAIAIATKDLARAVHIVSQAVERKSTIPILSMMRCRANGGFEITGSDLDIEITARVEHGGGPVAEFMLPQPVSVLGAVQAGGNDLVQLRPADCKVSVQSGPLSMVVDNSVSASTIAGSSRPMRSTRPRGRARSW